jgi:hypothetical protein
LDGEEDFEELFLPVDARRKRGGSRCVMVLARADLLEEEW